MSTLRIHDLPAQADLDSRAMSAVRGGYALKDAGAFANVNVNINQDIAQLQNVEVNALNNVGVIGAGFGPLKLDVNPKQFAKADVAF
ncbi:MAG: hypothetical protein ACO1N5_09210 [Noviherbaspirillum sp.]